MSEQYFVSVVVFGTMKTTGEKITIVDSFIDMKEHGIDSIWRAKYYFRKLISDGYDDHAKYVHVGNVFFNPKDFIAVEIVVNA